MQAAHLPMSYGWAWLIQGWAIFKQQPMAMLFWSLMTSLLINISYLIPLLGQLALIVATPALGFIALNACLNIERGKAILPNMWLLPLKKKETRAALLRLGVVYLGFCLLAGFVSVLPFTKSIMAAMSGETLEPMQMMAAVRAPFILFGILYLGISILFWHAPALMGWYQIPLKKALFYSMVACWRNKGALILFGVVWAAIYFALQFVADALLTTLDPSWAYFLLMPLNLLMMAVLYSNFYPIFRSIFGQNNPPPMD